MKFNRIYRFHGNVGIPDPTIFIMQSADHPLHKIVRATIPKMFHEHAKAIRPTPVLNLKRLLLPSIWSEIEHSAGLVLFWSSLRHQQSGNNNHHNKQAYH